MHFLLFFSLLNSNPFSNKILHLFDILFLMESIIRLTKVNIAIGIITITIIDNINPKFPSYEGLTKLK